MTTEAVAADLTALDPGAFLVPERIVRRVIRHERKIRGIGLLVPHGRCHVASAETVQEVVRPFELHLADGTPYPDPCILVGEPESEGTEYLTDGRYRREVARRLFHARVHARFAELTVEGRLTGPRVRGLINRIGQTRFDEIRSVLRHEEAVIPPADPRAVLEEFAAWWLELTHFDPDMLPVWFPALSGRHDVGEILGRLVDVPRLLEAVRLPGAGQEPADIDGPSPGPEAEEIETVAVGDPETSRIAAMRVSRRGNNVRAAILYSRGGDREAAAAEIRKMVARLGPALELTPEELRDWGILVEALLPLALAGVRSRAGRALFDLQKVCVERDRLVFAVDVVEWALTFGRRPIRRALPCARETLIYRYLMRASRRYERIRPEDGRGAELFASALKGSEAKVRAILKPGLVQTVDDIGLVPANPPERVAREKLIEELLDHAVRTGRLRMGDIRDAFSRSQIKLPDVRRPGDLWFRQPVLQADRLLSVRLDGVYTRGEFYLRWLQMLSSLIMGTAAGRWLTLWLLIPLLGSYLALEGAGHMLAAILSLFVSDLHPSFAGKFEILTFALVILGLIHSEFLRSRVWGGIKLIGSGIKALFTALPVWLVRLPAVVLVMESRAFALVFRYVLKPAAYTALIWALLQVSLPEPVGRWLHFGGLFLLVNLVANSPFGRRAEEITLDWLIRNWHFLRVKVFAGLLRMVISFFQRVLNRLDGVLYRVDELLRFRSGETFLKLTAKAILGTLWFFASYVVRLYVNLLIEPQVNPIKHFPVVTVAHKITLPMFPTLKGFLVRPLEPAIGRVTAEAVAGTTVFLMPGIFGFLVWELKENWRLFAKNRSALLRPSAMGTHGETLPRLLRPGFHSGTVPKIFARLRHATRTARETGDVSGRHRALAGLQSVSHAVRYFIEREFFGVLHSSAAFRDARLILTRVDLALNRISVSVTGFTTGPATLTIDFEEQAGWILVGLRGAAFLKELPPIQQTDLRNALAGLYALCGVELIREQIEAELGDPRPPYDIREDALLLWPGGDYDREETRPLGERRPAVKIRWKDWVACWDAASRGVEPRPSLLSSVQVLPRPGSGPML